MTIQSDSLNPFSWVFQAEAWLEESGPGSVVYSAEITNRGLFTLIRNLKTSEAVAFDCKTRESYFGVVKEGVFKTTKNVWMQQNPNVRPCFKVTASTKTVLTSRKMAS